MKLTVDINKSAYVRDGKQLNFFQTLTASIESAIDAAMTKHDAEFNDRGFEDWDVVVQVVLKERE